MTEPIEIEVTIRGPRGCGKTITLNELAYWLEEKGFFPVIDSNYGFNAEKLRATKEGS